MIQTKKIQILQMAFCNDMAVSFHQALFIQVFVFIDMLRKLYTEITVWVFFLIFVAKFAYKIPFSKVYPMFKTAWNKRWCLTPFKKQWKELMLINTILIWFSKNYHVNTVYMNNMAVRVRPPQTLVCTLHALEDN